MQGQVKQDNSSGIVRLQDDTVFWDYDNKTIVQLDLNSVVVIGEYTNSDGPYFDDWFLTFVTKDGQWQSIPLYADNMDELIKHLSNKFHQDFTLTQLANSTEWKSVVHYPTHLNGKPLFTLTPSDTYKVPETLLDNVMYSAGFGNFDTTQYITLTDEIKQELTNASR